jgi:hypothetical protein
MQVSDFKDQNALHSRKIQLAYSTTIKVRLFWDIHEQSPASARPVNAGNRLAIIHG